MFLFLFTDFPESWSFFISISTGQEYLRVVGPQCRFFDRDMSKPHVYSDGKDKTPQGSQTQ
jgi:hypothetical protein